MLLLTPPPDDTAHRHCATAVFGVGLIGASLVARLQHAGYSAQPFGFDWQDGRRQRAQLGHLHRRLTGPRGAHAADRLAIVWSAGRAGFAATRAQGDKELASYTRVLDLARTLADNNSGMTVTFHMLSSVGGLFEGQRHIDRFSVPRPLRPYGELKLRQENALLESGGPLCKHVYRLTSVFGRAASGARRGLVSTLLRNTASHQVTSLVGRLSTLRDFVWSVDVARHLAAQQYAATPAGGLLETLASGKPSSIHEVIRVVESVTLQRAYLQCESRLSNERDITVSPSLLPSGWRATDLKTAVVSLTHGLRAPLRVG